MNVRSNVKGVGCFASVLFAAVLVGCAAEAPVDADAPEAEVDELAEQDQGTSYGGWTQSVSGAYDLGIGIATFSHRLTRTSGSTTRGGGACIVVKKVGTSCSSDSNCLAGAKAQYGNDSWGYCYSGVCYSRPGGQPGFCQVNPNRTPGTMAGMFQAFTATLQEHVMGCMTKAQGPNFACGGTNSSLYMRTAAPVTYANSQLP